MKLHAIVCLMFVCALPVLVNAHDYSPSGCGYVISFPSVPELSNMNADNVGSYTSANLNRNDGAFLRAECIFIGADVSLVADSLLERMKLYVAANGLQYASYETGADELGRFVDVLAYKAVGGEMGTFRIKSYAGEHSYLSIYAASPSEIYPTGEITSFFMSVRKKL